MVTDTGGDGTGEYSLSLLLIPGPTVSPQDTDGGYICSGEIKTGTIDLKADTDAYNFNGETGQKPVITMCTESGEVTPHIRLYPPDGTIETVAYNWHCGCAGVDNYQLTQSGTYTIVVTDTGGDGTGEYSLSLTLVPVYDSDGDGIGDECDFDMTVCTSDAECDDGLFCNGAEECVEGKCTSGNYSCPDDGLFCNGNESCDEESDECVHSGDPCPEGTACEEDVDYCEPDDTAECTLDEECDDGLFCNGAERCVEGVCQPGNAPCSDDGLYCNGKESCDEENDKCVHSGDPCPEGTTCKEDIDFCDSNSISECSADFIASPLFGCAPLKVHFTELCEGDVVSYNWDFGDGTTSTEPNPTHTYPIGAFSPRLTCTSSDGTSDTEIKGNLIWSSPYCPLVCSLKSTAEVNILRHLRDHILSESIFGPIVVNLYYHHAAEVSEILYARPEMKEKLRSLVGRHIKAVNSVIKGKKVSLSEREVDEIVGFLRDLKEEGSHDLGRDVSIVIKALQGGYLIQGLGVSIE